MKTFVEEFWPVCLTHIVLWVMGQLCGTPTAAPWLIASPAAGFFRIAPELEGVTFPHANNYTQLDNLRYESEGWSVNEAPSTTPTATPPRFHLFVYFGMSLRPFFGEHKNQKHPAAAKFARRETRSFALDGPM